MLRELSKPINNNTRIYRDLLLFEPYSMFIMCCLYHEFVNSTKQAICIDSSAPLWKLVGT